MHSLIRFRKRGMCRTHTTAIDFARRYHAGGVAALIEGVRTIEEALLLWREQELSRS